MRRRDQARRSPARELDRRPADQPVADPLLALQRSAGNRAVSALLARAPETAAPKEDTQREVTGPRAKLPDIGTIALLSVQFGSKRGTAGRRREAEEEQNTRGELVLSSNGGAHSPLLAKAHIDSKSMDVEVIVSPGLTLKLKGAMVTSYTTSTSDGEQIESWTLSFESMERSTEGG